MGYAAGDPADLRAGLDLGESQPLQPQVLPLHDPVRVAEDAEILARGPSIMKGYHNLPEETAARGDAKYPLQMMTPNTKNRIHSQFGNLKIIQAYDRARAEREGRRPPVDEGRGDRGDGGGTSRRG